MSLEAITTELRRVSITLPTVQTVYRLPPYQYVIKRIERAQELMMQEQQSIANIALKLVLRVKASLVDTLSALENNF